MGKIGKYYVAFLLSPHNLFHNSNNKMTTFNPEMIQQIAASIFAKEQEEIRKQQEMIRAMERAEAAALKEAERQARIKAEAERIEAQLRAERALAEEKARLEKAEMDAAIAAELERLRNRTPLEILQDEVASLKKTIEEMKNGPQMKMTAVVKTVPTERKFLLTCPEKSWSCQFSVPDSLPSPARCSNPRNVVFTLTPLAERNCISLNSHVGGHGWGREERISMREFDCSVGKKIFITVNEKGFLISTNENQHLYSHRMPICLNALVIENGCERFCSEL
jgi:hypothetical protein